MAKGAPRELPANIGRYEPVRVIGVGAMGRVMLARDPVLGRHVAIKVLRDDLGIASDVREALLVRMRHEARAAARVTHPNLVHIHDMGEDEELGLYLVFEHLEGPTLKQRLLEGRLSARQAARIAKELGAALTFAHEQGVLHRDVKPENIILSPIGTKLTDFGIARVPDSTLTHSGGLLGTPAYSAPETFRDGKFSPESDQFSLAATLYEAIRGERAFPGEDAVSVASKIANDPPSPFADDLGYPVGLDGLLGRGMAKRADDRFDSCKELGTQVMEILLERRAVGPARPSSSTFDGDEVDEKEMPASMALARLSSPPGRLSEPPRDRKSWQVFVGGLAVLLLFGFFVRALLRSSRADDPPLPKPSASPSAPPVKTSAAVAPTSAERPRHRPVDARPTVTAPRDAPAPTSVATPDVSASASPAVAASVPIP